MTIPPVHNSIVQWKSDAPIYLNIFDTPYPEYFCISNCKESWGPFASTTYEVYMKDLYNSKNVSIYIPTTATTVEEARQLHPELFI